MHNFLEANQLHLDSPSIRTYCHNVYSLSFHYAYMRKKSLSAAYVLFSTT